MSFRFFYKCCSVFNEVFYISYFTQVWVMNVIYSHVWMFLAPSSSRWLAHCYCCLFYPVTLSYHTCRNHHYMYVGYAFRIKLVLHASIVVWIHSNHFHFVQNHKIYCCCFVDLRFSISFFFPKYNMISFLRLSWEICVSMYVFWCVRLCCQGW